MGYGPLMPDRLPISTEVIHRRRREPPKADREGEPLSPIQLAAQCEAQRQGRLGGESLAGQKGGRDAVTGGER